jgi:3-hydroxyisobutyrate dehydrogenase
MRVGFVGLGRMGTHMVRNLSHAGFELTLWNRSTEKSDTLAAELGCSTAPSPMALSEAVDVVVTMLADGSFIRGGSLRCRWPLRGRGANLC